MEKCRYLHIGGRFVGGNWEPPDFSEDGTTYCGLKCGTGPKRVYDPKIGTYCDGSCTHQCQRDNCDYIKDLEKLIKNQCL